MRPLHLELEIIYREGDGRSSVRRLIVKHVELQAESGQALLAAHCGTTNCFMEFHSSRIERCVELVSGEQVQDLPALLAERYACSRQGRLEMLQEALAEELAVLLTLGHADRLLQSREQELIAAFLHPRQPQRPGAEPLTPAQIASYLRWLPQPTAERFAGAVERLAGRASEELQNLFATCLEVVDVRAAREGGEQPAIDHLQARWFGRG